MDVEAIKAEIALLLTSMQNEPRDEAEAALLLHEKLRELRAYGMPLPQDLVDLERALDSELERRRLTMK